MGSAWFYVAKFKNFEIVDSFCMVEETVIHIVQRCVCQCNTLLNWKPFSSVCLCKRRLKSIRKGLRITHCGDTVWSIYGGLFSLLWLRVCYERRLRNEVSGSIGKKWGVVAGHENSARNERKWWPQIKTLRGKTTPLYVWKGAGEIKTGREGLRWIIQDFERICNMFVNLSQAWRVGVGNLGNEDSVLSMEGWRWGFR